MRTNEDRMANPECPNCGSAEHFTVLASSENPSLEWVQCQCAWYGRRFIELRQPRDAK